MGLLIISHAKRFIFIHNPKCAGTAFREEIEAQHDHPRRFWGIEYEAYFQREVDYAHLRLWELAVLFPELMEHFQTYNSVAFVRNPFQRFLSAINEHFKQYRPDANLQELPSRARLEMAESFIRDELTLARVQADHRFVHFSPQSWFLSLGPVRQVKHIIPLRADGQFGRLGLELLGLPATPVKLRNMMPTSLASFRHSAIIREFVMEFYRQDFQFFHADPALRPVVLQSPVPLDMERIFAKPAITRSPLVPPLHPVRRTFAALRPRKLVRRSVMELRRTFGF